MTGMRETVMRLTVAGVVAFLSVSAMAAPAANAGRYTVTLAQMRYGAIPTGLKVGDTIVWVNRDTVPHTVTARDHSFDLRVDPGKQVALRLGKAGTLAFYCIYHPTMRGSLKVAP